VLRRIQMLLLQPHRGRLGCWHAGRHSASIYLHSSLLYCVGILGSTTARHAYASRCGSDVQKMLISKRREPAAYPKRPARVVFDLLNLTGCISIPVLSLSVDIQPSRSCIGLL
jgi:hypothetical protein